MQIMLRNDWFAPDGTLYPANRSPHTIPADWEEVLPKSAEVLKEVKVEEPKEPAKK